MFSRIIFLITSILYFTIIDAQEFSNWGYWLTDIDPSIVQQSEYEMMVIDYSRTGNDLFSAEEVASMKIMPSGKKRLLISYFSIGEAEEYRSYWKEEWKDNQPSWLEKENPDWPGNYKVKYWDPTWQDILFGNHEAYLDIIIANGFDGVYLDIIDAFEYFEDSRASAEQEMVYLIRSIAKYARTKNPHFHIITQNGERLLGHPELLEVINGAAKEDLFYGLEGDNIPAPQEETDYSLQFLNKAKGQNKYLLLASYVHSAEERRAVKAKSEVLGLTPYFGPRDLHRLIKNSGTNGNQYYTTMPSTINVQRTPGDFFLNTLYKNQFKSSIGMLVYDEQSIYSEQNEEGMTVFSEDVIYTDQLFPLTIEYGLSDHLEVGVRIPITRTRLQLTETVGGDSESDMSEVGLGNIALTANLSIPLKDESNLFSLLTMEYGIPTDTKSDNLRSSSFAILNYTIEKIWNNWGVIAGVGASNFNINESLDNTQLTYRMGALGVFSDRVFGDVVYSRRANGNFMEASVEVLVSQNSSLEFFFAKDLEKNIDVLNYGITFTLFH